MVKPSNGFSTKFKTLAGAVLCFIVIFSVWFYWQRSEVAQTNFVETKVKGFLKDGLESMALTAPRVRVNNSYYAPDVLNLREEHFTTYAVYTRLLYELNIDLGSPMVKVSSVMLDSDMVSKINATAQVTFEYLPGIKKTITVDEAIPVPHYKLPTGAQTF